jgi:riboflavin kinase
LGIPTANIPLEGLAIGGHEDLQSGVYYGWAGLDFPSVDEADAKGHIYPMVMSIGWNPFYKNTVRSIVSLFDSRVHLPTYIQEVHIMHDFGEDFYGHHLNLLILGFIRPEYDYVSKESLIQDIQTDIKVTQNCLEREAYGQLQNDLYLKTFPEKSTTESDGK